MNRYSGQITPGFKGKYSSKVPRRRNLDSVSYYSLFHFGFRAQITHTNREFFNIEKIDKVHFLCTFL